MAAYIPMVIQRPPIGTGRALAIRRRWAQVVCNGGQHIGSSRENAPRLWLVGVPTAFTGLLAPSTVVVSITALSSSLERVSRPDGPRRRFPAKSYLFG